VTTIEPLNDDAIDEAAEFLTNCWREVYVGILDADVLNGLTTASRAGYLRQHILRGAAGLVQRDDTGAMVGVSFFEPGDAGIGFIDKVYVRPDLIGTGLGHALLIATEDAMISSGYTVAHLDVYPVNQRAIRFYESHGYTKIGEATDHLADHEYPLDVMTKPLCHRTGHMGVMPPLGQAKPGLTQPLEGT